MLDQERIINLFKLFSSLESQQLENWKGLCENAARQLTTGLRRDINISANMERLCTTAAALAYADYLLLESSSSSSAEQIKLGDISIKSSSGEGGIKQDSQSIRDYFLNQIEDLLQDTPAFILPVGD